MKDLEIDLKTEYTAAADRLIFRNKERLLDLYDEPVHTRARRAGIIRFAAIAAAAALLLSGTTAFAMSNPKVMSELRALIDRHTTDLDITDEKKDELEDLIGYWHVQTPDIASQLENLKSNSYGEVIGGLHTGDLFGVAAKDGSSNERGYVYRYDYGLTHKEDLLPEEAAAIEQSSADILLLPVDQKTGSKRSWVYVFDFEGMRILGKYNDYLGFVTNEMLEDPEYAERMPDGECCEPYKEFVQNRINYKKEHGEAPPIDKFYDVNKVECPTEGYDRDVSFLLCQFPTEMDDPIEGPQLRFVPPVSNDVTAVSSDPEVFEVKEFYFSEYGDIHPHPKLEGVNHKVGTATITVKDGGNTYLFEFRMYIDRNSYMQTSTWLNEDEYMDTDSAKVPSGDSGDDNAEEDISKRPTEGYDKDVQLILCQFPIRVNDDQTLDYHYVPPVSNDVTAISSDPEVFEIKEFYFTEYGDIHPHPSLEGVNHKVGRCTITVKDGENEYLFEFRVIIEKGEYIQSSKWLNEDEYK